MRLVAALAFVPFLACAPTETESAAESPDAVVGGHETLDVPAIGYLAHGFQVEGRWLVVLPFCTGTLIAPDVVLTAAHCVETGREKGYSLHFGTGVPRQPRVLVPVKEAVMHPAYLGQHVWAFDVAYLILETPIRDVPLATASSEAHAAHCDYVSTGYGTKKQDYVYGEPVLDSDTGFRKALSVCADPGYVTSSSVVTNGTIRTHSNEGAVCVGDSGGPLRVNNTRKVVGILSNLGVETGTVKCSTGAFAYYAPVAQSMPFINQGLAKSRAR